MSSTAILYLEFYMSLATFLVVAFRYAVPALRKLPFASAVAPVLLLHSFRHMGMMYLAPAAVPSAPEGFAVPTGYGDLAAAALALLALGALWLHPTAGRAAVWVFNVVGFADLALAAQNASRFQITNQNLGPAWFLPAIVVPALLVTHGLTFWLLLRRAPAVEVSAAPAVAGD